MIPLPSDDALLRRTHWQFDGGVSDSVIDLMAWSQWAAGIQQGEKLRSHKFLRHRLAVALKIAILIRDSDDAWRVFARDPFFRQPPSRKDPFLVAVKYVLQAGREDIQEVSRNSRAIKFFHQRGVTPEELPQAIETHDGGIRDAALLFSKASAERKIAMKAANTAVQLAAPSQPSQVAAGSVDPAAQSPLLPSGQSTSFQASDSVRQLSAITFLVPSHIRAELEAGLSDVEPVSWHATISIESGKLKITDLKRKPKFPRREKLVNVMTARNVRVIGRLR